MNIGVIFAGGVGSRMHSREIPKQFLKIHNKPIIIHTIEYFENNIEIDAIVVVCVEDWIEHLKSELKKFNITKVQKIVKGSTTGQLSIYNGLLAAEELACGQDSIVLVHDGVRPLINNKLISENILCVKENNTAITTSIVKETIVSINDDNAIDFVPSRVHSRVAKAPQSFWLKDIISAHRKALNEEKTDFIDCCTMMKYYGHKLTIVDGPYENIKITTPDDYYTMRAILDTKENSQIYGLD